ncbi:hypothetical protein [Geobacter sp.]|uniref:hypothetical protein n=1 Tax=Geobacter sp. TaxID=46610 RepID=UPI0027BAE294|nr:hypothetical protein [Geobacter sp.]
MNSNRIKSPDIIDVHMHCFTGRQHGEAVARDICFVSDALLRHAGTVLDYINNGEGTEIAGRNRSTGVQR